MRYYDEEKMQGLRNNLEKSILKWDDVVTKKMFGCPCYKAKNKLFAFMVTDGIVITNSTNDDKTILSKKFDIAPFVAGEKVVQKWIKIPVKNLDDVKNILPYIRKSFKLINT